jgi:steroid 5-alpha reductase family enzyme
MAKTMIYDVQLHRKFANTPRLKGKKLVSHGSYRAKRKPNSPRVKARV